MSDERMVSKIYHATDHFLEKKIRMPNPLWAPHLRLLIPKIDFIWAIPTQIFSLVLHNSIIKFQNATNRRIRQGKESVHFAKHSAIKLCVMEIEIHAFLTSIKNGGMLHAPVSLYIERQARYRLNRVLGEPHSRVWTWRRKNIPAAARNRTP